MEQFLKTPFLPEKRVSHVIVDGRVSSSIISSLHELGIDTILTPALASLYPSVRCHPDMLIHPIGDDIVVAAPDVYDLFKPLLMPLKIKLIRGKTYIKSNYPESIAYNVARINNVAFHNITYTDPVVRDYLEQKNVRMINVKQGYAKCSVCIVNEHAIITSDRGIANAADTYNLDVLLIRPGYILLPGLNYGFVGGATGLIARNQLAAAGSLNKHPDFTDIVDFCSKYNVEILSLGDEELIDIGSIIPIKYKHG
ncbi:DUF6873 family GME fold protein [Petroclostridium sp. X23]|uniref:DUF6873 family GME fold protein n=1 Tax=Petroclostridium sp. X23 TaxID=3045146 RepID=UPI0024AD579D|nr:hypothetical protein [Petroclostridium sp. X23]WHH59297.1 hypothetical protein QKW49_00565 [Petroclostridium sp. X23]